MLVFCNRHPVRIWTALSFLSEETCGGEGGNWESTGWWAIDPGSCVRIWTGDVADHNRYWYYYAEGDDGAVWSGPFPSQVDDTEPFSYCDGLGVSTARWVGFRELDVGDADDYTLNFTL